MHGAAFTIGDLRCALGAFATGVTVVTTAGPGGEDGLTANSFTSVSLEPPLVLVCVRRDSRAGAAIARNCVFAVNVLAAGQEGLSARFARADRRRGAAAFCDLDRRAPATGCRLLRGAAAHFDCRLVQVVRAGDHAILLGRVVDFAWDAESTPLVFHGGRYAAPDAFECRAS